MKHFFFFLNIESVNVTSGIDGGGETRQSKERIRQKRKHGEKNGEMTKYTLEGG